MTDALDDASSRAATVGDDSVTVHDGSVMWTPQWPSILRLTNT